MAKRRMGTTDMRLTSLEREVKQLWQVVAERGLALPIAREHVDGGNTAKPPQPHAGHSATPRMKSRTETGAPR